MIAGSGHAAAMSESPLRGLALLPHVRRLIELALDEDLGRGDVTSPVTVGHAGTQAVAEMNARVPLIVVFGLDIAAAVFAWSIRGSPSSATSSTAPASTGGARRSSPRAGPAAGVLAAERTALNFAQRLSGVATLARATPTQSPGPVRGSSTPARPRPASASSRRRRSPPAGARNHRFDLGRHPDQGQPHRRVRLGARGGRARAGQGAPHPLRIEVEVTEPRELDDALAAGRGGGAARQHDAGRRSSGGGAAPTPAASRSRSRAASRSPRSATTRARAPT
jgi:nicotinate-nucleotide pyrophosphorylase (carboxylating)